MLVIHMDIKNYTNMKGMHREMLQGNTMQEVRLDDQMVFPDPQSLTNDSMSKFLKIFLVTAKIPKIGFRTVKKMLQILSFVIQLGI